MQQVAAKADTEKAEAPRAARALTVKDFMVELRKGLRRGDGGICPSQSGGLQGGVGRAGVGLGAAGCAFSIWPA